MSDTPRTEKHEQARNSLPDDLKPIFDEYTVVLRGSLHVRVKDAEYDVRAEQAIIVKAGEWVQYSTPSSEGAEYIAVCIPAFSLEAVHREGA